MSWFKKLLPSRILTASNKKKGVPEGIWQKCSACNAILYRADVERNLQVCPTCQYHLPIKARTRILSFIDPDGPRIEIARRLMPIDYLKFRDSKRYKDRLQEAQQMTGENDALVVFKGRLFKMPIVVCAFEYSFIGGSMGAVVGEKFVRAVKHCQKHRVPLICFAASGGARMQEGLISLMQMAKTSAALAKLSKQGIPYISVLTDPTMGGVSASLAMLGDIIIAEPRALIGFAGPRVIAQTVREILPDGFQRSEFLLEHGAIDLIIDRRELRLRIAKLLAKLSQKPDPLPMEAKVSIEAKAALLNQ